ncbi:MAG: translocation/assembly module TamB domain-containing protein [Erythrobacter sp.]
MESEAAPDVSEAAAPRRWAKRLGWALAAILAPLALAFVALNSPIGKRFIADQIASYAPVSGLRIAVGRIEGDIYHEAVLHDVVLSDPKGRFLVIPRIELDWRPLAWITRGLDIRKLVARRGRLERWPELLPGDPDKPVLPDFDIRIDRFEIDNLTLAKGVATQRAERVDLVAKADVRDGLVALRIDGDFGRSDHFNLGLHAEPDGDRFDLDLDYRALAGGPVAGLLGAKETYAGRVLGKGTWRSWRGHALVSRGAKRFAAFRLTNRAGQYRLAGEVYPGDAVAGYVGRLLGARTGLVAAGTLEASVFDGRVWLGSDAIALDSRGVVDLAENRFEDVRVEAVLRDPRLFGDAVALESATMRAELDGGFREFEIAHDITASELRLGETRVVGLRQEGTGRFADGELRVPLALAIGQVETGSKPVDAELVSGKLTGELAYRDGKLTADPLGIAFPRLAAQPKFEADLAAGTLRLVGPARLAATRVDGVGTAQANARLDFALGGGRPWSLRAELDGTLSALANATLRNLAGERLAIRTGLVAGGGQPLRFDRFSMTSQQLRASGQGSWHDGRLAFAGRGSHTTYGPFDLDATVEDGAPSAVLLLANPLPAAGLRDVRLALAPVGDSFRIETTGTSALGEFVGVLGLTVPDRGATLIDIEQLRIWRTLVAGRLALEQGGARGRVTFAGGGLTGAVDLVPEAQGQGIAAQFEARDASFGGATPIELRRAQARIEGVVAEGRTSLSGELTGRELRYGRLSIGRLSARGELANGTGRVTASVSGRQGELFALDLDSRLTPDRIATIVRGTYAGMAFSMPQRAVMTRDSEQGSWRLSPALVQVGDAGRAVVSGAFGSGRTEFEARLVQMPLKLGDLAMADLGLGGSASGVVTYRGGSGLLPVGEARIKVAGLTRSGTLLASRPLDLALVSTLEAERFDARASFATGGTRLGWMQARILGLPQSGELYDRLQRGALSADLRYDGTAEALWRLAGIDALDFSGPLNVTARASGTLASPQVSGALESEALRVRSPLSGTDIRDARVTGSFRGSRLLLRSFSGKVAGGGTISGSGTVDLAEIGPARGPRIDVRASAKNARLLDARGLRATVTGPLRIVSSGNGGTIAGRVEIDRASWRLGNADEVAALPEIATREINLPGAMQQSTRPSAPWRYLVDARARNRIDVDGMGLDSEWRADIRLRGTTADPRLGGEAQVVRGTYSFAGTRFELTRGRITFDESVPIDPRLDIVAESSRDGVDVTVNVRGNALSPEITFTSDPALPEEEILARLLFGGSITSLTPTDALQLGAALASLRSGGGGLDPINSLRNAIGLDRLRIVSADPALGSETGVALGKNIGRRFYVELVTDGRGYSATQVEFRITSWLSLLGAVSTLGRNSVLVEISRDY